MSRDSTSIAISCFFRQHLIQAPLYCCLKKKQKTLTTKRSKTDQRKNPIDNLIAIYMSFGIKLLTSFLSFSLRFAISKITSKCGFNLLLLCVSATLIRLTRAVCNADVLVFGFTLSIGPQCFVFDGCVACVYQRTVLLLRIY